MRGTTILVVAAVAFLAVSGCGSSSNPAGTGAKAVAVTLTDAGCDPARLEVPEGPTSFEITNDGADAVSEFEILKGDKIVAEAEHLTPGLSRKLSVTLKPGTYRTLCPGGRTAAEGELVVTAKATT